MRLPIFLIFSLICCTTAFAQKQNNNWCGSSTGLTFNATYSTYNTGLPAISVASASVSDRTTGDLLFYADPYDVYNKNFVLMPNGQNISSSHRPAPNTGNGVLQGVNIAPFVNDTNKYYLFTLMHHIPVPLERGVLAYSVVDMTLNGGLGDVVAGQKNIPIDSGFSSGMVITEGCDFYWLIVFKLTTGEFYAYKITATGIDPTPVISKPTTYTNRAGRLVYIKVSPDRKKLAYTTHDWLSQVQHPNDTVSFAAVHDFNALTGKISGGQLVDTLNTSRGSQGLYSCEFSPNSTKLYTSAFLHPAPTFYYSSTIFQYDLSRPYPAIANMRDTVFLDSFSNVHFLQMGQDSLIYSSYTDRTGNGNALASISNPNAPYPGCTFNRNAIFTGSKSIRPQPAVVYPTGKGPLLEINNRIDTAICLDKAFVLKPSLNAIQYVWQDGSQLNQYSANNAGVFWVRYPQTCGMITDSFIVAPHYDTIQVTSDTIMCKNGFLTLSANITTPGSVYKWSTGSTGSSISIASDGKYWVTTTEVCTVTIDSIEVTPVEVSVQVTSEDTLICYGDTVLLSGIVSPPVAAIKWNNNDTALTTKASAKGRYTLSADFSGCNVSDNVDIMHYPIMSLELGSDTEICSNEPLILPQLSSIDADASYKWQDGATGRRYVVTESGRYTVQITGRCGTLSDEINITARDCHLFFPSGFSPNGDGRNDVAHLLGDIANVSNYRIRIYNRRGQEVFTSTDIYAGWDGTYNGKESGMDSYYYFIKYTYLGKDEMMKGDIILVR